MFFNAGMAADRDVGVALLSAWAGREGRIARGWEMTAATGVRGLRLLVEAGALDAILLTESNGAAARVLAENVARYAALGATMDRTDARRGPPDGPVGYVDLDPYGSPLSFLEAAIAAVARPGLLAVTATDMRVLGGADPEAARRRYGGLSVRGRLGPEAGLRLLLAVLASRIRAAGAEMRPALAYVGDHHVRAYVVVARAVQGSDPVETIDPARWDGPPLPPGPPVGPLWTGPLFDANLVRRMRPPATPGDPTRSGRLLARFQEEIEADRPFFYESNVLAGLEGLGRPPPVDPWIARLRADGWRAARTHARAGGFRTDAPRAAVVALARSLASVEKR